MDYILRFIGVVIVVFIVVVIIQFNDSSSEGFSLKGSFKFALWFVVFALVYGALSELLGCGDDIRTYQPYRR